ncbi:MULTISPECIES: endolytic transglycosylase MltG [unclassified Motilimonas]|uniref:endolytic transglycosylase MltG n=1 Tax=Motilimonas TaxID=1914248 RepID=UPI001E3B49F1|nr:MULTISPECIES: endolytic transglycosylase MltG [unclassified Motilimonas]MCE0556927.1 endolytic transglycosylase MltG [Motilimonas sp. E26]MDO6525522.1 endolytic transglycosylase MltG [Motilimonas sp. 1_MG-2023]
MIKKIFLLFLFSLLICAGAISYLWHQLQNYRTTAVIKEDTVFTVPSGSHFRQLESQLVAAGIIKPSPYYVWLGRLYPELTPLKSGTYHLQANWTIEQVLQQFVDGKEYQFKLTLIEGSTYKQWKQQIEQVEGVTLTGVLDDEAALAKKLGLAQSKLEGFLQPQTYLFPYHATDLEVIERAYAAQQKDLDEAWQNRAKNLPLKTPYEALILASIIEKESGHAPERKTIASVFINRLNANMRLQTDPTVIYGMGDRYDGNIRRKDLREATPYNTYVIDGLPPTPIAMPGKDAINAALNPADTPYYYFVSMGNGEHYFSKNLAEHNRAVRKYILKK